MKIAEGPALQNRVRALLMTMKVRLIQSANFVRLTPSFSVPFNQNYKRLRQSRLHAKPHPPQP
ncbi:MAG: hypothetical protein WAV72_04185, partial [Bradyrhizobium sp.]